MINTTKKRNRLITNSVAVSALLLLVSFYALQTFSPLRLNTDAITLLSMAASGAHGDGLLDEGRPTVFSPAYPAIMAGLLKVGIARSFVIILLNLLFLLGGILASYRIMSRQFFEDRIAGIVVCCFALLSWVVIKHFPLPLTDVAFFGVATGSIALLDHASTLKLGKKFVAVMASAWGMMVISILVRAIGVSLVPAFVFVLALHPDVRSSFKRIPTRVKLIVGFSLSVGFLAMVSIVVATSVAYLHAFAGTISKLSAVEVPLRIAIYRVTELGELAINIPASKTPAAISNLIPYIGIIPLVLIAVVIYSRYRKFGAVDVFFCSYTAVLFAWPYYDARFWLPVVPLSIGYIGLAFERLAKPTLVRHFVVAYCILFAFAGIAALEYSTRLTFSGAKFPELYGDGSLRPSYCAVYKTCSAKGSVDLKVVHLIETYR